MAQLVRHIVQKTGHSFPQKYGCVRLYATRKKVNVRTGQRFDSVEESLAAKGFLRPQKPYTPPSDVPSQIRNLCQTVGLDSSENTSLKGDDLYKLLEACFKAFNHGVPNSLLHTVETVGDVVQFYKTNVTTTLPLDAMKSMDLPENLHILHEYHRFHPETDTMFNGKSAFPKSSTLVTGLKYKGKYPGHTAKTSWP